MGPARRVGTEPAGTHAVQFHAPNRVLKRGIGLGPDVLLALPGVESVSRVGVGVRVPEVHVTNIPWPLARF